MVLSSSTIYSSSIHLEDIRIPSILYSPVIHPRPLYFSPQLVDIYKKIKNQSEENVPSFYNHIYLPICVCAYTLCLLYCYSEWTACAFIEGHPFHLNTCSNTSLQIFFFLLDFFFHLDQIILRVYKHSAISLIFKKMGKSPQYHIFLLVYLLPFKGKTCRHFY